MYFPLDKYSFETITNILVTPKQLENLDFVSGYDIALMLHDNAEVNRNKISDYIDEDTLVEKLHELGVVG